MDQRELKLVLKLQDDASRELKKISGDINAIGKQTDATTGSVLGFVKSIGLIAAAYKTVSTVFNSIKMGVQIAADLETAEVGLKTLLGSAEKASKTIARIKQEAIRTPFEIRGLSQATQLLTSVTKDGDESIDILLDVGEALVAMGKGQPELDRIIVNLQQVAAMGHAATIDIKQFAFAGIPIYEMLAETTGKTGDALEELITSGGVTFELLTDMFDKANDAGGQFFEAYKNNAGTYNQLNASMTESIGVFFATVAEKTGLMDLLKDSMTRVGSAFNSITQSINDGGFQGFFDTLDEKTGLVTMLADAWDRVVEVYNTNLKPALAELWAQLEPMKPFLDALVVVFGTMLVVAIGAVILVMGKMAEWFIKALTWGTEFSTFVSKVLTKTIDILGTAIFKVTEFIEKLIEKFKRAIDLAKDLGGGSVKFITSLLPGKASGGPVTGGSPYIVGEKGPELFVPGASGNIVPNHALAGGSGITINVYGDVSDAGIIDRVKDALAMDVKRAIRI